jgi:Polyketide cyclase / dehydrase and lipid transport
MPLLRLPWVRLAATNLAFADLSPQRFEVETLIYTTPERVFEILTTPEGMDEWLMGFKGARWLSPAPHGVGSVREVYLGPVGFRERFLAWEPGKRLCFVLDEVTVPLVRRLYEDIHLESAGMNTTHLRWLVYYEPSWLFRLMHPAARLLLRRGYAGGLEALSRYVLRHSTTVA